MNDVELIIVPYDGAHRNERMGRGPLALIGPLRQTLEASGHRVASRLIESQSGFRLDAAVMFELARAISGAVSDARARGALPIVLSGNCSSALGTVAGLGGETGVIWYDAHGDLNTPETTRSGFLDGTALATLIGGCWRSMAETIPGWFPVDEARVILVGARDLEEAEATFLETSRITRVATGDSIGDALSRLDSVSRIYLHIDLDVFDSAIGRANAYAAANGLTWPTMSEHLERIAETGKVAGVALTAYDPQCDSAGAIAELACKAVRACLARKSARR